MFLPSGRVHSIGAGLVLFEVQQNSDTTYRVYDWGRVGLDGKPRELHVSQSLASIDFNDFEPAPIRGDFTQTGPAKVRPLVNDPLFSVEAYEANAGAEVPLPARRMQIIAMLGGTAQVLGGQLNLGLAAGQFCLVPASLQQAEVRIGQPATFLRVEATRRVDRR
jgi:mannose-6-phosphate isomerase